MSLNRENLTNELQQRVKESYDAKDQGLFGGSIFKPDKDLRIWKCLEGKHYLDVIPYIAGPNNPRVKEGKPAHNLDIWVHYRIGPNDLPFICLAKNFNQPCPVCEYRKELSESDQSDEDSLKALLPKHRTIYNVIIRDGGKEEKKGVQIWDVAHFFFEVNIASISERPRQGGFINWPDPDSGKQIMFERKGTGATNTKFQGHAFVDRDYVISDEDLAEAYVLDDLIIIPDYDEIKTAIYGGIKTVKKDDDVVKENVTRTERVRKRKEEEVKDCPGTLGKDVDKFDQCQDCNKYQECADEYDHIEEEEKKAKRGQRLRR